MFMSVSTRNTFTNNPVTNFSLHITAQSKMSAIFSLFLAPPFPPQPPPPPPPPPHHLFRRRRRRRRRRRHRNHHHHHHHQ